MAFGDWYLIDFQDTDTCTWGLDLTGISTGTLGVSLQRAALTGFAVAAEGSNATTSAEPIISYAASSNMSAGRVATRSPTVRVDIGVANQVRWHVDQGVLGVPPGADGADGFDGVPGQQGAPGKPGCAGPPGLDGADGADQYIATQGALTGEVLAAMAGPTSIVRSTNFATSPWTGAHTWSGTNSYSFSTTGDFNVVAASVGLDSDTTMLVHADNDLTLESDADVVINCDALRVASTTGAGVAGFIIVDAVSASTPTLADEEGMFWCLTGGANPSTAAFTNDSDEDWMLAQGGTNLTVTNATGNLGTIDISTVPCGGTVIIGSTATGNHQIEGFTAKDPGFFFFVVSNTSFTTEYLHQDATPTATNRLVVPGAPAAGAGPISSFNHATIVYASSRWRVMVGRA